MKIRDHKILLRDKQNLARRLERRPFEDQPSPVLTDSNIHYEIAERARAIGCGGIGAIHTLVCALGLDRAINENIMLLRYHFLYWESDHIFNIAYNVLTGGTCLEDIERLRNDETYMNGLGAARIPDPTTAGDFLRRFDEDWIFALQEAINHSRKCVWRLQNASFHEQAIIDIDGTVAPTTGQCKEGMDTVRAFRITNDREMSMQELVLFANGRCNQENVIGQLKSGVNALRMPSDSLLSNGAYMVIAALAWNLKAWYGLVTQASAARKGILRMEFKRFLLSFVQIPCQILRKSRRLVYRIVTYSPHLETFLETFERIKKLRFV